jgi:adenylylsulfate reductase subunit B
MGASVVPLRSTDSIMWTVKFRNGTLKRFKFPTRTTPEGKAQPAGGYSTDPSLDGPALFTEPDSLGLPAVWTNKK